MKIVTPVLPHSPDYPEVEYAKNQPQYRRMRAARIEYVDGYVGVVTRYRLSWLERLQVLFFGNIWVQLLTGGLPQPQIVTAEEPKMRRVEKR